VPSYLQHWLYLDLCICSNYGSLILLSCFSFFQPRCRMLIPSDPSVMHALQAAIWGVVISLHFFVAFFCVFFLWSKKTKKDASAQVRKCGWKGMQSPRWWVWKAMWTIISLTGIPNPCLIQHLDDFGDCERADTLYDYMIKVNDKTMHVHFGIV
jgi:hypothetical protein